MSTFAGRYLSFHPEHEVQLLASYLYRKVLPSCAPVPQRQGQGPAGLKISHAVALAIYLIHDWGTQPIC